MLALGARFAERRARLDEALEVLAHRERAGRHEGDRVEQRPSSRRPSTRRPPASPAPRSPYDPGRSSRTRRGSSPLPSRSPHAGPPRDRLHDDDGSRVARDRVAALPAVERDQAERHRRVRLSQRAAEHLDRVRAAELDVRRPSGRRARRSPSRPARPRPSTGAARGASTRIQVSVLPAQPTVRRPSSSLSRLTRIFPWTSEPSSPFAPSRPTSSATVIRSCSGPCGKRGILDQRHHRRDRNAVVGAERGAVRRQPVAVDDQLDPSLGRVVRAVGDALADHVEVALEDDQGADSRPAVAGTSITRLRAASCRSSNPCSAAHARTCSMTGSSWRDGRAIVVTSRSDPRTPGFKSREGRGFRCHERATSGRRQSSDSRT